MGGVDGTGSCWRQSCAPAAFAMRFVTPAPQRVFFHVPGVEKGQCWSRTPAQGCAVLSCVCPWVFLSTAGVPDGALAEGGTAWGKILRKSESNGGLEGARRAVSRGTRRAVWG